MVRMQKNKNEIEQLKSEIGARRKSMNIREKQELFEQQYLSPFAAFSATSIGREKEEEPCDIRPIYQRDRDRILHCKAFRRLKDKTQVFFAPTGDHYRTRLTHTLEVSQNARTIAKALRLNQDLTEAIALGHDLGHTPFGHAGEHALNEVCSRGFKHYEQSVRIVEKLENKGQGLNLSFEVRDGILNHQTTGQAKTLEGRIVRLSDKIAYIYHDIDDAIRGKVLTEEAIPKEYTDILGHDQKSRLNRMIHDIIIQSDGSADIRMSEEIEKALFGLRKFMFQNVYTNPVVKREEQKCKDLLIALFEHYKKFFEELPIEYQKMQEDGEEEEQIICDYIAGMTDHFALAKFQEIYEPKAWSIS